MSITEPYYLKQLFARAKSTATPLSGTFELTKKCNFNCKMCYIHHGDPKDEELSAEQWKKIIADSARHGALFALLTGGEPLIREDFREIYLSCIQHGMLVSVNTNASLIDGGTVEFFRKNPPHRINVSMYGVSPETYLRLCENPAAYERTASAAVKLKQAGIAVKINLSVSDLNSPELEKVFEFGKEHGIPVQASTYMFPPVRRSGGEASCFSREQAEKSSEYTLRCLKCSNTPEKLEKLFERVRREAQLSQQNAGSREPYKQIKPCRAGEGAFWVSAQGKLMACGMMPQICADLLTQSFDSAWRQVTGEAQKLTLPLECSICKYRFLCDVCAASYSSDSDGEGAAPEYQCRRARELYRLIRAEAGE